MISLDDVSLFLIDIRRPDDIVWTLLTVPTMLAERTFTESRGESPVV
ncbi:MAG: hypothetical protein J07HQW2_03472 [Haloquadratum walsbyi J07HQW2]|uniref:Uncharacterized protein n=1 Tax=Haloquadratum walsbyi J07HQW2 TaxID=1238425 RepID=U1PX15_9EURY|nr:MAG: hypothetical protein J07HQW2_03472 [Haloquadratum walsbyi J07HQW2]